MHKFSCLLVAAAMAVSCAWITVAVKVVSEASASVRTSLLFIDVSR